MTPRPQALWLALSLCVATSVTSGCASSSSSTAGTAPVGGGGSTPQVVATPSFSVAAGSYNSPQSVGMTDSTPGASIYYTTDGTTPTAASRLFTAAVPVNATTTLKAIAAAPSYTQSGVTSATYSINVTGGSPNSWDVSSVPGQVAYNETLPFRDASLAGAGFIHVVTAGGVDNTGATDAACALQALFSSTATRNNVQYGTTAPWQDQILFFPNGTYLLSNATCLPLVKNYSDGSPAYGLVMLGESQSGVVLKSGSNVLPTRSFTATTASGNRTMTGVSSTSGLHFGQLISGPNIRPGTVIASASANQVILSQSASGAGAGTFTVLTPLVMTQSILLLQSGVLQQFGNAAFHNVIENMTFDLATNPGNQGGTALAYLANNMGTVRNVTIKGPTDGSSLGTAIDMTVPSIGPALVENVLISGFRKGIDVANLGYGVALEHITLDGQSEVALANADNVIAASNLWVKNGGSVPNVTNSTGNGFVTIANSRFDRQSSGLIANTNSAAGAISIKNTTFATPQSNLGASTGPVNGILQAQAWTAGSNFLLPLNYDTPVLPYDSPVQWSGVASGKSGDWTDTVTTPVDATTAFNAALTCNNNATSTLYIPHGVYYISHPIQIPSYVDRIVGMDSTIRILPSAAANFPSGTPLFEVQSASPGTCPYAATLIVERLAFDPTGASVSGVIAVQADAPASGYAARTVVLRDMYGIGIGLMKQQASAGEIYLENTTAGGIAIAGPNWVMSRQYNSEGGNLSPSRVVNTGANLWILGYKTEGPLNLVSSTATTLPYAVSEFIGGYFYSSPGAYFTIPTETCAQSATTTGASTSTPAMFVLAQGAKVEASFIEEVNLSGTKTLANSSYPFYSYANGICQAGASNTTSPYPAIHRVPNAATPGEAGYIVPQILVQP